MKGPRHFFAPLLLGLALIAPNAAQAIEGMTRVPSPYDVETTVERLTAILNEKALYIFARLEHHEMAAKYGQRLRPTVLLIFGNPKLGAQLMRCAQTVGIDVPMKALIYLDVRGQTWLAYNDPGHFASRHRASDCPVIPKMQKALAAFAAAATALPESEAEAEASAAESAEPAPAETEAPAAPTEPPPSEHPATPIGPVPLPEPTAPPVPAETAPAPMPLPEPAPVPLPEPEPMPEPEPEPMPMPEPEPMPMPEPEPMPMPEPVETAPIEAPATDDLSDLPLDLPDLPLEGPDTTPAEPMPDLPPLILPDTGGV